MDAQKPAVEEVSGKTRGPASHNHSGPHGCVLPMPVSDLRTGLTVANLKQSFLDTLFCTLGRVPSAATPHDLYTALALAIRDRVLKQGVQTLETYHERDARVVAYLSAEYLPGPHLANNLLNLGIWEQTRQAVEELGCDLDFLRQQEEEPGLGNGGLGRLASCFSAPWTHRTSMGKSVKPIRQLSLRR